MEDKLEKILKKILKVKILKNLNAKNCKNWDSIAQMSIIMQIEENFEVQFSDKEIYNLNSVDKIKKILTKKIKN
jgi:acyl carrier protein